MKKKTKNKINTISNTFNKIYDFAIAIAIILFIFGRPDIAFHIFLYGGSFYLLSLGLKLIANDKNNKKLTYLGIFLSIIITIITIFNITMSIKWIGK